MKPGRKAKYSEVTKVIRIPESREKEVLAYLNKVPKGKARAVMALIEKHLAELSDEDEPAAPAPQLTLIASHSTAEMKSSEDESPSLPFLEVIKSPQDITLQSTIESLHIQNSKVERVQAVIERYKSKIHPTSPRWENARILMSELETALKDDS